MDTAIKTEGRARPWNKGKLLGQKPPLKLKEIRPDSIATLLAERREMNRMRAELRPCLAAIASGESSQLGRNLVAEFCALYRRHILTEESEALTLLEHSRATS